METYEIQKLLKDPKEMLGALYGTLLGDASMTKPNPGNSRLTFGQNNQAYAIWKAELFSDLGFCAPVLYDTTWRSQTNRLPMFSKMYHHIYHNGRKTVTEHLLKTLNPLGLALLFYDDGDFHKEKQEVKIATMGFNEAEHTLLQKGLFKKFDLHFNIHTRKSAGGNRKPNYFYLRLKKADTIRFFELIKPFKTTCMNYKFPTVEGLEKLSTHTRRNTEDTDTILTNQVLFDLYYKQGLNFHQMSEMLGVNSGTIYGRVQKLEEQLASYLQ